MSKMANVCFLSKFDTVHAPRFWKVHIPRRGIRCYLQRKVLTHIKYYSRQAYNKIRAIHRKIYYRVTTTLSAEIHAVT